jgi:hypothetical protein
MSSAKFKFGGKLIKELSQKIPSTLFALNELIKNAYDAFSPDVTIKIDPSKQTITISDNGNGMGTSEIDKLFHISQSSKSYGHVIEQGGIKRITQGSKGLGFLAAFKFGDKVKWVTCKNEVRSIFSVDISELVSKEDLSGIEIPITTNSHTHKGTSITVYSNAKMIEELLDDLSDDRVAEKLAATIMDDSFGINIEVGNQQKTYTTRSLKPFVKESEGNQLFHVLYKSKDNEINFYHKGLFLKSLPGPSSLPTTDYSIDIELIIFFFGPGKNSKSISALNRRIHDDSLHPLVYINRNLFNNNVIFDPEALRKKSSGETLPQMIGRVNLYSHSNDIDFNSDRTNFVENSLTKSLVKNLKSLNELIQTNGAELKKELQNSAHGKKVPTGKSAQNSNSIEPKDKTASILIDRQKPVAFYIPSHQIDIEKYIFQVKDSLGKDVKISEVEITVSGQQLMNNVLQSIEEPCEKIINFRYQDSHTNLVSSELTLTFDKKVSNISGKAQDQDKSIFTIESGSGYQVNLESVSEIIHAVDKAYSSKSKDEFLPLIACSIRSIFEISADKLFKTHKQWFNNFDRSKFNSSVKKQAKDKLLLDVAHTVILLKVNPHLVTAVSNKTGISYSTLNNLLNLSLFKSSVKNSHIGAHQSTRYLTKPRIESCADICGLFSVICDSLVYLDGNNVSALSITNVTEADLNNYLGIAN